MSEYDLAKSTRTLAETLTAAGHAVSDQTVPVLLRAVGYSFQANAKTREGKQHRDRDAQFRHIHDTSRRFLRAKGPVVSVDTKKKELVGVDPGYKNGGREWQPAKTPVRNWPSWRTRPDWRSRCATSRLARRSGTGGRVRSWTSRRDRRALAAHKPRLQYGRRGLRSILFVAANRIGEASQCVAANGVASTVTHARSTNMC